MEKDDYNTYLGKAYRFITYEGFFNTIENKSLRFARLDTFNDPLDSSPFLAPRDWARFQTSNLDLSNFIRKNGFQKYYKSLYACCFCKEYNTKDSYLMWSHYGKSHTQLCFEIDFSVHKYLGGPSEITYPDDLRVSREELKNNPKSNFGLFVATTKLKQWSYEKEVRLIVDTTLIENKPLQFQFVSNDQYLNIQLDLKLISKVIFGINSEIENESKTIEMIYKLGLNPDFQKLIINPDTLNMESIPYSISK